MALSPRLTDLAANAAADAVAALLAGGEVRIYDGGQPATADTAITTQTLLVACALGSPAFGAASGGVVTANPVADGTAVATGTAAWFRAVTSGGAGVFDGSVGTSGANLNLPTVTLAPGVVVSISGLTYTQPKAGS
jgi:hypothetical protein